MGFHYKSDYVDFDIDDPQAPLLYCIYEIVSDWSDLERYLRGTIGKDPTQSIGGELDFNLRPESAKDGHTLYYAWVDEYAGIEPNEGYYGELTVKSCIKDAFSNMLCLHPERESQIREIFKKYDL